MTLQEATALIGHPRPAAAEDVAVEWADLGCGSGLFTRALAAMLPSGSIVHAVDRDNPLKPVRMPTGSTIHPVQADFLNGPGALPPLDGILIAQAMHYVADKPAFLQLWRSAFRGRGRWLVVEYELSRPVETWVPYPLPFRQLKPLFREAGYANVERLGERPSRYHRGAMYAALITE